LDEQDQRIDTAAEREARMQKRLAIILLNFNHPTLTIDCLSSIEGEVEADRDIVIVVDNGSRDDSVARIEAAVAENQWHRWVRLVRCSPNRGFAGGNNVGILSVDAQWYVLLNNDTIVPRGTMAALLAALQARQDVGLIGPSMEDRTGARDSSCFREIHPVTEFLRAADTGFISRLLSRYDTNLPDLSAPTEVDWIGFACVLIRREVIEQVGLLDAGYYFYFEDTAYCRCARDAGWKILYWPDARIVHFQGETTQVTVEEKLLQRRPRYYYESRARYFAEFYGRSGLWAANILWALGRVVSLSRELLFAKKPRKRSHEGRDNWIGWWAPFKLSPPREEDS
jgi:GT2 family glycosyltransferase